MKSSSIIFNRFRCTFYSDISLKIEFSPDGKFIDRELFVTEINDIKPVKIKKNIKGKILNVETNSIKLIYKDSMKGLSSRSLKILYKYGNRYKKWYYGEKDKKNLKGASLDLFKFPKVRGKVLSSGVLSKNGYYVYEDFTYTFWKTKKWADMIFKKGYKILFFIGYGDNYEAGLQEYSRIFGKVPMIPEWAFGFWYSRWYNYHQNDFIKLVDKYRSLGIPIDVIVVDTDWRNGIWKGYDWSDKYFPSPNVFIKEMKKRGIKLTLNDHPGYNESEILPVDDSHFKEVAKRLKIKSKDGWRCNWGDEKSVKTFFEVLIKPKLKQGIDFWWIDGWGADGIYRNEEFFEKNKNIDKMQLGVDGYKSLNPQLWLNFFYYKATEEVNKNRRAIIFSRWGGVGSHRYPIQFSGDTFSDWRTLAYEVYFTYTGGNLLANYWSNDIGGFLGKKIDKKLFIRWVQFGCFSPIMRTHSDHGIREPWKFDTETVQIFRKYIKLRYRLVPYFYRLSFESYKFSRPILRALYYEYPKDRYAYKFKYQYMIGNSVLVAPVVSKNDVKKVYFPEGEWLSIDTGENFCGPIVKKFVVPLSRLLIFIKKGSIIPVAEDMKYIGEKKKNTLQFEVFADDNGKFEYYEDDGISNDYKKGKYCIIPIKTEYNKSGIIVTIYKLKGKYNSMPNKRKINLIIHCKDGIEVKSAVIKNKKLKIFQESKVFGEIDSKFNSYKVSFFYNSKTVKVKFTI